MPVNMHFRDMLYGPSGFEPPNSTRERQKTIAEISCSHMESLLEAEHNAAGSTLPSRIFLITVLVDGIVYTDDLFFFLAFEA